MLSCIFRLYQTAFSVCKLILSLDPLRDPMGVLLSLDFFCLATNSVTNAKWLFDLVESGLIRIHYRDSNGDSASSELMCLPNWSFSYALAKFRLHQDDKTDESKREADTLLQDAIRRFPTIIASLLQANSVDTAGRSFRRDWATVLDFDRARANQLVQQWSEMTDAATIQALKLISQIFVQQHSQLWSSDDVLDFMYDNLLALQQSHNSSTTPHPPSAAMTRYIDCDPDDYQNKVPQLPQDANIVDPGLIARVLHVDLNQGRFLRRMRRDNANNWQDGNNMAAAFAQHGLFNQPMHEIDPDLPLLEVFLRR
jgi:hypothetical protein